jgi:hypothetical protein
MLPCPSLPVFRYLYHACRQIKKADKCLLPVRNQLVLPFEFRPVYEFFNFALERTRTRILANRFAPGTERMLPPTWPVAPRIAYADMLARF